MELYLKNSFISIFSILFLVFKHDFSRCFDYTHIAASTQQVITSQIRSHIEYLIQTSYILVLIFLLKLVKNLAIMADFNTI